MATSLSHVMRASIAAGEMRLTLKGRTHGAIDNVDAPLWGLCLQDIYCPSGSRLKKPSIRMHRLLNCIVSFGDDRDKTVERCSTIVPKDNFGTVFLNRYPRINKNKRN